MSSHVANFLDCQDLIDFLAEVVLSIYPLCDGNEELFEEMLELILVSEDSLVALEVESRVWQSVNRPQQNGQNTLGSPAWNLD